MIRPKSITIEGFRSFRDETTYHFPSGNGLYLVTGRNKVEPKLQSNGTGKSTLFDAMCWCLYGKSARGLKAGNVSHWSGEYLTTVQLTLEVTDNDRRNASGESRDPAVFPDDEDGVSIRPRPIAGSAKTITQRTIRRTHNPNSLRLDGEETDQSSIDQLIGLNYDAFLSTVLLGQFNRFFFDLSPTEKLNVFSNALDLQQWITPADRAKHNASVIGKQLDVVQTDIATTKAVITNITKTINYLVLTSKEYEKSKQQSKQVLTGYIQQREPELINAQKQLKKADKELTRLQDELDRLNRQADKLYDQWTEVSKAQEKQAELNERLKELSNANGVCPTCGQPTDKKHLRAKRTIVLAGLEVVNITIRNYPDARKRLEQAATEIQEIKKQLDKTTKEANRLRQTQRDLQVELQKRWEQITNLDNENNPHQKQLQQLKKDEFTNRHKLDQLTERQDELSKRLNQAEFWQKAFKELRLWVIQEAIQQLQIEVDNSLTQLGLHGWKVKLAIEKENKNGKLSRGFTVNVQSPDSEEKAVPWESWSGGETQRIRMAGANALQKLIQSRNHIQWGFEVFDEPTQHLSERGISDLLTFLEAKAKEENRQIWIISHQQTQAGNFDGVIEVVKGRKGSRIVEVA